jgi:hypothetical protein
MSIIFHYIRRFESPSLLDLKLLPVHYTAISVSSLLLLAGLFFMNKNSASR